MGNNFNPFLNVKSLANETSLNKLKIMGIPGYTIDSEVIGKRGSELISNDLIVELIKKYAENLKINLSNREDFELPMLLDISLSSKEPKVQNAAKKITRRLGRNLGYILVTLKRGDLINKKVRPKWTEECWEYWHKVDKIILTGGLLNGNLGYELVVHAKEIFKETNTKPYNISIAKKPSLSSIQGVARLMRYPEQSTLLFDFGQTLIKRCVGEFKDSKLEGIYTFESRDSKHVRLESANETINELRDETQKLKAYMLKVFEETWQEALIKGFELGSRIGVSIGNNIVEGKLGGGGYEKLKRVTDDFQKDLSKMLSERIGYKVQLEFFNDGTAAAEAFSHEDAVIITLGTAIGVGFTQK